MQDNVTQAVDWDAQLEAYHPDGRCFPVEFDRRDHHVCYLRYHPFGETVYYDDGAAYDDDSEWRVRHRPSTTAQSEAVQKLVETAQGMLPKGVCLTNRNIPDDFEVPLTTTMGELRALDAALAAHRESQP